MADALPSTTPVLRLAHAVDPAPRIVTIPLDVIFDGDRLRDIDPAWAAALAADFEAGGEPPPIVVRRPEPGEAIAHEFALVAGGHRVAAYRLLDRPMILAEIRPITRLQGRLVEIEENLFRHELNALDRAVFLSEHRRVWDEIHPERRKGGDRKSQKAKDKINAAYCGFDPRHFTEQAAERCGLSRATIERALALVAALSPEAIALLRGTAVARNAAELKRLSEEPAERQVLLARAIREGGADTVAQARVAAGAAPTGDGDPQEDLFRRICSSWERLDAMGRKRFLAHAGLMPVAVPAQTLRRTGVRT